MKGYRKISVEVARHNFAMGFDVYYGDSLGNFTRIINADSIEKPGAALYVYSDGWRRFT